jgi:hypothetical protein
MIWIVAAMKRRLFALCPGSQRRPAAAPGCRAHFLGSSPVTVTLIGD